jgi:hypothetical protein
MILQQLTMQILPKSCSVFRFWKPWYRCWYLYDDIELVSGAETLVLPLTFESAKLTYSFEILENTAVVATKCYRN